MTDSVLITGGNSGIGLEAAKELAREGWHVLIASRNRAASDAAARHMHGKVDVLRSTSPRSTPCARWCARSRPATSRCARWCATRACSSTMGRVLSNDGFELTFAANHLGHFLLTNLLLERLAANAPARIVVVASGVHDPAMKTGMPNARDRGLRRRSRARADRAGRVQRPARLREQQALQPLVRLRARAARRSAADHGERLGAGARAGLGPHPRLPCGLRVAWDWVLPGMAAV